MNVNLKSFTFEFSDDRDQEAYLDLPDSTDADEDEMLRKAIAMSLEEQSRVIEEEEEEE